MAMDEAEVGEPVDEELHGEGDEEEAHDADEDADAGFAEERTDAVGAIEDEVTGKGGEGDGGEDGQHLPVVRGLADEDHDARDSSGTGEHGNPHGDDAGVFFGGCILGFAFGFLGGRAAGLHHVDADEHEDQAAGDFKGGELDTEEIENELAGQGKGSEDDEAGNSRFASHAAAPDGINAGGNGNERGDGGEGIDEKEDGAEGEERELDVGGVEGFFSGRGRRDECGKLLNQLWVSEHDLWIISSLSMLGGPGRLGGVDRRNFCPGRHGTSSSAGMVASPIF